MTKLLPLANQRSSSWHHVLTTSSRKRADLYLHLYTVMNSSTYSVYHSAYEMETLASTPNHTRTRKWICSPIHSKRNSGGRKCGASCPTKTSSREICGRRLQSTLLQHSGDFWEDVVYDEGRIDSRTMCTRLSNDYIAATLKTCKGKGCHRCLREIR